MSEKEEKQQIFSNFSMNDMSSQSPKSSHYQTIQMSPEVKEISLLIENKNSPVRKDGGTCEAMLSEWWSIFPIINWLRFKAGFYFFIFFIIPTTGFPIYWLIEIINEGDEHAPIFKTYLNTHLLLICLFINFTLLTGVGNILNLFDKNNSTTTRSTRLENNENTVKSDSNSVNIIQKFNSFVQHICFSWPFTLVFSGVYTFVVAAIHPDFKAQDTEWGYPLTYPIFIVNLVHILWTQLFWMMCYLIQKRCQFHDSFYTQDTQHISKLESMKSLCKDSLIIVEQINDRSGKFITILISLAFCGLLFPVAQYRHLWKNHQLDTEHHIAIMLWIFLSMFWLLYSIFRAIKIPLTYHKTVKLYSINVSATTEDRTKEFNEKNEIVKKELFSESPHLMFGGLTPINMNFLAFAFLIQILNLICQWSDLVPYKSLSDGTFLHQYQPYFGATTTKSVN